MSETRCSHQYLPGLRSASAQLRVAGFTSGESKVSEPRAPIILAGPQVDYDGLGAKGPLTKNVGQVGLRVAMENAPAMAMGDGVAHRDEMPGQPRAARRLARSTGAGGRRLTAVVTSGYRAGGQRVAANQAHGVEGGARPEFRPTQTGTYSGMFAQPACDLCFDE